MGDSRASKNILHYGNAKGPKGTIQIGTNKRELTQVNTPEFNKAPFDQSMSGADRRVIPKGFPRTPVQKPRLI